MINQTVKTDLTSWQICLGMLPLPDRIIQDIESGTKKHEPETFFKKVILTPEQVKEIEAFAEQKTKEKLTAEEIYDQLIKSEMLPTSIDGRYPSLAKISDIISEAKKRLGLHKGGKDNGKLAYEMKINGASDAEIAKSLGLKESSIRSIASKHKKKLERGELC